MRVEFAPFGVDVIIIEPGVIKTNFMKNMKMAKKSELDTVYKDITTKVVSGVKMMVEMGTPPKEVANTIVKAIKDKKPLPRYVVGNDALMFLEAKRVKQTLSLKII